MIIPGANVDILDRLKFWRDLPPGTPLPPETDNAWAELIHDVCAAAIKEIEILRVGAGYESQGFREIKDGIVKKNAVR